MISINCTPPTQDNCTVIVDDGAESSCSHSNDIGIDCNPSIEPTAEGGGGSQNGAHFKYFYYFILFYF